MRHKDVAFTFVHFVHGLTTHKIDGFSIGAQAGVAFVRWGVQWFPGVLWFRPIVAVFLTDPNVVVANARCSSGRKNQEIAIITETKAAHVIQVGAAEAPERFRVCPGFRTGFI